MSEPRIPERKSQAFGVFAYRDFRLLFSGQLLSRTGTWMQFTSLTYFIGIVLTHSAAQSSLNLAFLGAAQMIPALVFGPIGGVVADIYPRRRTLLFVATARASLALAFTVVALHPGSSSLYFAMILAAGFSTADAFDAPARLSLLSHLVPRNLLVNAMGTTSIANNIPFTIGPAVAGILLGTVGVYFSFLINAVAQTAVLIVVALMRPSKAAHSSQEPMHRQIVLGLRFVAADPVLRWAFAATAITAFCISPYTQLLATLAGPVLHLDAKAYGIMLSVGGLGTVSAAVMIAAWRNELRAWLWFVAGVAASLGLAVVGHLNNFLVILAILTSIAFTTTVLNSVLNLEVQFLSPIEMRGRSVSLFTMLQFGLVPAGTLVMGGLASAIGLPLAYTAGGAIAFVFLLFVWFTQPMVRTSIG